MIIPDFARRGSRVALLVALLSSALVTTGCHSITGVRNSVPASAIDSHLFGCIREAQVPILLSSLGQEESESYRLGAGDTLSVYVYGIIPTTLDETPVLQNYMTLNQKYYPPRGSVVHAATGIPMTVDDDGSLELPLVGRIAVAGMTVEELSLKMVDLYKLGGIIVEGRQIVNVTLILKRVERVIVLRQDTPSEIVRLTSPEIVDQIHRGSGEVIDLPAYENDVLHALSATGGMPGTDSIREVWVMRNSALAPATEVTEAMLSNLAENGTAANNRGPSVIRIPLYQYPGEPLSFGPEDVVLHSGDVVYVPRRYEYFYTGGMLGGAKVPLPRDEDTDILEAIALVTRSIGGPNGGNGINLAGGSVGYIVKATRAVVVRKLPDGEMIRIRVDLAKAMDDEKERILIQPDDLVMMYYTPSQLAANAVVNFFGFNFSTIVTR